jgi:hypothetical protein
LGSAALRLFKVESDINGFFPPEAVESRSGAVAEELRFQIPLIKPDVRISRISAFGQGIT